MSYNATLGDGTTTTRVIEDEESYVLTQGFAVTGTVSKNEMVKLNTDGTIASISALTQRPIGRVVSNFTRNDVTARVAIPCESMLHAQANGTVAPADLLACSGYDSASGRPIYKTAVTTNYVSAIAFTGNTTGLDIVVGILRQPYLI